MILRCADGLTNKAVALELGVYEHTVGKWRRRFLKERIDGLSDEPRNRRCLRGAGGFTPREVMGSRDRSKPGAHYVEVRAVLLDPVVFRGATWRDGSATTAPGPAGLLVARLMIRPTACCTLFVYAVPPVTATHARSVSVNHSRPIRQSACSCVICQDGRCCMQIVV